MTSARKLPVLMGNMQKKSKTAWIKTYRSSWRVIETDCASFVTLLKTTTSKSCRSLRLKKFLLKVFLWNTSTKQKNVTITTPRILSLLTKTTKFSSLKTIKVEKTRLTAKSMIQEYDSKCKETTSKKRSKLLCLKLMVHYSRRPWPPHREIPSWIAGKTVSQECKLLCNWKCVWRNLQA